MNLNDRIKLHVQRSDECARNTDRVIEEVGATEETLTAVALDGVRHMLEAVLETQIQIAEQARIANLIALANSDRAEAICEDFLTVRQEAAYEFLDYVRVSLTDEVPRIHPAIAEALGLGATE